MKHTRAFTLVELSIVLVIIGLLVGGVLAGQSLVRAAELRAIGREATSYRVALTAFYDKYNALPADMANATSYWGAAHATPSTCEVTSSSTTATCNGNGDGYIGEGGPNWREPARAFKHLANAGLVEGSYNGVMGATYLTEAGQNVPGSKFTGGTWSMYGASQDFNIVAGGPNSTLWFPGRYGIRLFYGARRSGDLALNPILKPEDAYNVDAKMDDGNPTLGMVRTPRRGQYGETNCIDSGETAYSLSEPTVYCALVFITGF